MGETAEVTEQSLDQQLEELFQTKPAAPAVGPDGKEKPAAGGPGSAASPDPAAKPKEGEAPPPEVDPLEEALKEIKDDGEEKPAEEKAPQLSQDQQAVLAAVPTPEVASQLYKVVQNYQNFVGAFEKEDFANVEGMFEQWNPAVYENFLEFLYQKHMVNGDWAERFIAEAEGKGGDRKQYQALQKQIADMNAKLKAKDDGEADNRQKQENQRVAQAYESYVDGLFDQIKFAKGDRKWVMSDLNLRVGADQNIMAAVRKGNMSAINGLFKAAVREYVNRDKEVSTEKDKKIEEQDKKKPLVSGGAGAPTTDALPEDIKQVPKGQEDNWMMQELGKLAKKVGLKK